MKKEGLLKQIFVKVIWVLIAFFSLNISVDASSFAYNAFDWDKFYEENVDYWTDICKEQSGNVSLEDCLEVTLSGKKDYYINLYKILAKYEKKGYKLNDNILLATTFYYLTPDTFSSLPEEYLKEYMDGSAYKLDDNIDAYDVDMDLTIEYFENEKDTLKMLTKHMFAYPAACGKIIGRASIDENGNSYCPSGELVGNDCVEIIDTYKLNYTEYWIEKFAWLFKLFGFTPKYRQQCESNGGKYIPASGEKIIHYETYWRFLEESEYFDDKVHLTTWYSSVLEASGHTLMKEMSSDEKEAYEVELKEIRKNMILEIQSILKSYGTFADTPDSYFFTEAGMTSSSAWWPIGSNEITTENGINYALGDPTSVTITSGFGPRDNPFGEGGTQQHTGIDIAGVTEGVTNVIAVKDGVVIYPTEGSETNCPSSRGSSDKCGGGYGNYVIIQHNDGTYSLYAHLYAGSITVTANDSVKQGQVIGKVGNSGYSTGPHLHFEIRQGANSSTAAVDPLKYISSENPRTTGSSSDFLKMLHYFEGSCNAPINGNNYVVHDDGYNIPTVGYGVALIHNVGRFNKYGIDVSNMKIGDEIPIGVVDQVKLDAISTFRNYVQNYLAKYSISLAEYQIDCLTMISYQFGNLGNFGDMYIQYGNTESLRQNTMTESGSWYYFKENPSTSNGRAEATWKLFHEGVYTYDQGRC